jgi:hypothetical protein
MMPEEHEHVITEVVRIDYQRRNPGVASIILANVFDSLSQRLLS